MAGKSGLPVHAGDCREPPVGCRPEHPNPAFHRSAWLNLNGPWSFAVQGINSKIEEETPTQWDGKIKVPFCLQAAASGAGFMSAGPLASGLGRKQALWYRRSLPQLPEAWRCADTTRVILHIGACDSSAIVSVNGVEFPEHHGGSTPFAHDITEALSSRTGTCRRDELLIRCTDAGCDGKLQPCGKQLARQSVYSGDGPHLPTLYSNVSGLWQTVWLEAVNAHAHLERVQMATKRKDKCSGAWYLEFYPDISQTGSRVGLEFEVTLSASQEGPDARNIIKTQRWSLDRSKNGACLQLTVPAKSARIWCPEDPHLYGLRLRLRLDGRIIDEITSYTGLRTVRCRGDQVLLNGEARYLRLVLDQGYYPTGLWTAPTEQALKRDITLAMEMGFNGARLHQKVFEPLYFYHADKLGFLVFAEYPDWVGGQSGRWETTSPYRKLVANEWDDVVRSLHNHPSIIAWGPFNEFGPKDGWKYNHGAGGGFMHHFTPALRRAKMRAHKQFVRGVVKRVRKMDKQRRPVHDSSGWIHLDTDLWSFHNYTQRPERMADILANPQKKSHKKYVDGRKGQPLLVAEYGGVAYDVGGPFGKKNPAKFMQGYNGPPGYAKTKDEVLTRVHGLTSSIYEAPSVAGFCYTQLYDVEYEKNGLLRYDRTAKFSKEALLRIFGGHEQTGRWKGKGLAMARSKNDTALKKKACTKRVAGVSKALATRLNVKRRINKRFARRH